MKQKIKTLLENNNFRNNQNYILGNSLKNDAFSLFNRYNESGENIIGFNENKKIQNIDIYKIKAQKSSKILFYAFSFMFVIYPLLHITSIGNIGTKELFIIILIISILLPLSYMFYIGFYKFDFSNHNYLLLKNKDKLIIIKK